MYVCMYVCMHACCMYISNNTHQGLMQDFRLGGELLKLCISEVWDSGHSSPDLAPLIHFSIILLISWGEGWGTRPWGRNPSFPPLLYETLHTMSRAFLVSGTTCSREERRGSCNMVVMVDSISVSHLYMSYDLLLSL